MQLIDPDAPISQITPRRAANSIMLGFVLVFVVLPMACFILAMLIGIVYNATTPVGY